MATTAEGHSSTKKYWIICLILFAFTGLEFGVYEIEILENKCSDHVPCDYLDFSQSLLSLS